MSYAIISEIYLMCIAFARFLCNIWIAVLLFVVDIYAIFGMKSRF